jgi:hypothetical protein
MTRTEAHRLLDAVREGEDIPARTIRLALLATGDLADDQPPPLPFSGRCDGWKPGVRVAQAERREAARARVFPLTVDYSGSPL